MDILYFLRDEAPALRGRLVGLTLLAGLVNAALVAVVIQAAGVVETEALSFRALGVYLALFLLFVISKKRILDMSTDMMQEVIRRIRDRVARRLRRAELLEFEGLGIAQLEQVLIQDCWSLGTATNAIVNVFAASVLIVAAMAYIAWLSPFAFVVVTVLTTLSVLFYTQSHQRARAHLEASWEAERKYINTLKDLTRGFKELKVNRDKAKDFFGHDLGAAAKLVEQLRAMGIKRLNSVVVFGQSYFYALLGLLIFGLPQVMDLEDLPVVQVVAVIIFIMGPIAEVVGSLPIMAEAGIAVRTIRALEASLSELEGIDDDVVIGVPRFEALRLEGVTFQYPSSADGQFELGPIDLEVRRGEVLFLVGGNGTGKSTLLKVLAGFYEPKEGSVLLNERALPPSRADALRGQFSIILQDFHLFGRLLAQKNLDHSRVDELLSMLGIDNVTELDEEGVFSTLELSAGQRKRVALLVAELDDREIFLFDEWAADQDPVLRQFFYREYLPALKARGKTVIAATHDDHYFDIADRVLKLNQGKIEAELGGSSALDAFRQQMKTS